jgi:glycerol-3-phosphate O-acyltransferase
MASPRARTGDPIQLDAAEEPITVLASPAGSVERSVIEDWVREAGNRVELCAEGMHALAVRLNTEDDPLLVPVRVVWLPRERRRPRLFPRSRPARGEQARILRREPERCRVVVGEPARVSELRERWHAASARPDGAMAFAAYVARQAELALDRAQRSVVGHRHKKPRFVAEALSEEPQFRAAVAELAQRLDEPFDELREKAGEYLTEIAAGENERFTDLFMEAVKPTFANAWTVRADTEMLESLRELNREHALIFLPSHRSYADSWLLSSILREHDFPRCHTLGGANMNFWPLGPVLRRAGYVLLRRSFRDDELYKLVVREYFGYLVSKRFNLEWYIEGGRSRTGKLRPPRYGLLRYLVDGLESGRAKDAYLVPVSINYDQLAEVGTLAAEQRGQAKKPENALWFARFVRGQQRHLGDAQVRFGEPLSLREGIAEDADARTAMQKVVFEVCDRINRATPVTATALVTIALLGSPERALTVPQVHEVLGPLLDYVDRRRLPGTNLGALRGSTGLRTTLDQLRRSGVVTCFDRGVDRVYRIEPGQHQVAAYSRNTAIHWFVNRAIIELAVFAATEDREWSEEPRDAALAMRDLLKYEFFFPRKRVFVGELSAELELVHPSWRDAGPADARLRLIASRLLLAPRVLRPFLESYLVTAERLAEHDPDTEVDEQSFLDECGAVAEQYQLQGYLRSPEAVSSEAFGNALNLAGNRGLLRPGTEGLAEARRAFHREIAATVARFDEIDDALRWED